MRSAQTAGNERARFPFHESIRTAYVEIMDIQIEQRPPAEYTVGGKIRPLEGVQEFIPGIRFIRSSNDKTKGSALPGAEMNIGGVVLETTAKVEGRKRRDLPTAFRRRKARSQKQQKRDRRQQHAKGRHAQETRNLHNVKFYGMTDEEAIIRTYGLAQHPEGGWYREFHRSERVFGEIPGYPGPRPAVTAIWFCLRRGEFSAFHRLRSEEIWIHLAGGPIELVLLFHGKASRLRIASVENGETPVAVIPAGAYQAARPIDGYGLVSCIVAPGFDFRDFELASREKLLEAYPSEAADIFSLTR